MLTPDSSTQTHPGECPRYLSEQIITYIGNKRALLPFIGKALECAQARLGKSRLRLLDLFSGSGIVARYFKQYAEHIIANDLEAYSKVSNQCYLHNAEDVNQSELSVLLQEVRERVRQEMSSGFIAELYSPCNENNITPEDRCFYTRRNAMFLDTAAQVLKRLDEDERNLLLGPLLSRASVHANTAGVFKGFYKNAQGIGQFGGSGRDALTRILGEIDLELPVISRFRCDYEVHQRDANVLAGELPEVDLAYIDPPYNQHPYGSNYFMLNLLVDYRRPVEVSTVSGIPTDWNRSTYNKRRQAGKALLELVEKLNARFVLISYNSEGFVEKESLIADLKRLGTLTVMETPYNTFRGSRNLRNRDIHVTEFLYLLEK